MATYFTPKKGVTYFNKSGPNQGVTAGPVRQTAISPQATYKAPGGWYGGQQYWAPGQGPQSANNTVGGSNSFEVPSGPSAEEIAAIYQPIYEQYDQDTALAGTTRDANLGLISQSFDTAGKALVRAKDERILSDQEQAGALNKNMESAYSQAVRAYNALQQQGNARFGRGNSAGQAVNDLANQEFYRQQGELQTTNQGELGNIQKDYRRFLSFVTGEEQRLETEKRAQEEKERQVYSQQVSQISNNRALSRSEQAAKILDAKTTYAARKADVNNQLRVHQLGLEEYAKKINIDMNAQLQLQASQRYQSPEGVYNNAIQSDLGFGNYQSQAQAQRPQTYAKRYNNDDELDDLNNPYFS